MASDLLTARHAGEANALERFDLEVAREAGKARRTPLVRALGRLSELADQPPLLALCALTVSAGLLRRDARLAATGVRMLVAFALATGIKSAVKQGFARTRPHLYLNRGLYRTEPLGPTDGDWSSFPSGHTAGAVAVSGALAAGYPAARTTAYAASALAALIQLPRATHYPSDLLAGLLIGLASGRMAAGLERRLRRV